MSPANLGRLGSGLAIANAVLTVSCGLLLLGGLLGVRPALGLADVATAVVFWSYLIGTPLLAVLAWAAVRTKGIALYVHWVLIIIWLGFVLWTMTATF